MQVPSSSDKPSETAAGRRTSAATMTETAASKPPSRCQFWLPRKNRGCSHPPLPNSSFCGHHAPQKRHLADRVPCPVDHSHTVLKSRLESHVAKCTKAKRLASVEEQPFFCREINAGGHGDLNDSDQSPPSTDLEWAKMLATRVLMLHQKIFTDAVPDDVSAITLDDICGAIQTEDLSKDEFGQGDLQASVDAYRLKSGGKGKHLVQQASMLGHLRRLGALPSFDGERHCRGKRRTVLEMGAGRGMMGLMAASVAATDGIPTTLVMVERGSSRSKAENALRRAKRTEAPEDVKGYMDPGGVNWKRVECDLLHCDISKVLSQKDPLSSTTVVAKHLCGAGTDLALKCLEPVRDQISSCIFATCCHGLCTWELYVGRDSLCRLFESASIGYPNFGATEFKALTRWSCGSTLEDKDHEHSVMQTQSLGDFVNVHAVAAALQLACGVQGLGRACQRLIDYGRRIYIEETLFLGFDAYVDLMYYVAPQVTPQNAALVASRHQLGSDPTAAASASTGKKRKRNGYSKVVFHLLGANVVVARTTTRFRQLAASETLAGDDVAEIGCSTGETSKVIWEKASSWVGVDISEDMVRATSRKMEHLGKGSVSCHRIDVLGKPSEAQQLLKQFNENDPSLIFIDVGGNRELDSVLRVLFFVIKSFPNRRLVVVKSEELFDAFTNNPTINESGRVSSAESWLLERHQAALAKSFPKHPLKAPLVYAADGVTPVCRYHNYHSVGCKKRDNGCPFAHVCHRCLCPDHTVQDCSSEPLAP